MRSSLIIILLCYLNLQNSRGGSTVSGQSDRLALLDFKRGITSDPFGVMTSWNDSVHFCKWIGVSCNPSNQSVLTLVLGDKKLVGSLPPSIGNLTSLVSLNLTNNYFHGHIPQEIGRLLKLQFISLMSNSFTGEIPSNLTHCTDLRIINLRINSLVGSIPDQLSSLTKLTAIAMNNNNLTGKIPPWIGNFSSLVGLSLQANNLQGEIPEEIGRLPLLRVLLVFENKLSGMLPSSLYNSSSMIMLSVAANTLQGRLPPDIGLTLPNLIFVFLGINNFTGPIPVSLTNMSGLDMVDFSYNQFSGSLPMNLGRLENLTLLNLRNNQIRTDLDVLMTSLANCTRLEMLSFDTNRLTGNFPESIANLTTELTWLALGGNEISGSIPIGIQNLVNLNVLHLDNNLLTGTIPFGIGRLSKLGRLKLQENKLSGLIPSSIGNLSLLNSLDMGSNSLEGSIPPSLSNCQNLLSLNLSYNSLNGTIPKEIFSLSSLSVYFTVSHNSLSGPIPLEVRNLKNIAELYFSKNKFTGEVPSTIDNCVSLEILDLDSNLFQGAIPQSFSSLRALRVLNLSSNNFSGTIPEYLEKLRSLTYLDLSFNDHLVGEVPKQGIFANSTRLSIEGNNKLCGGISKLQLPVCSIKSAHKSRKGLPLHVKLLIGFVGLFVFMLSCFATWYCISKSKKRTGSSTAPPSASEDDWRLSVSYAQLFKATEGFSKDNLIGVGSFSSVYKAVLRGNEPILAVKVLNLDQVGAAKSFVAECKALRNIRHRNLVKILTVCSSVDSQGNDFKALVFELMSNGNLDQWLHPDQMNRKHDHEFIKSLNLSQRLNIAFDVASALEYLHGHSQTPIAHCDLKPSNVLLDDDMTAHVTDFGLARILFETTNSSTNLSVGLKGSIGYIPPEYGMGGQASIFGDIYSYGILLLEMFTGKRPMDEMFKDGLSLHSFAMTHLPDRVNEIVDPVLLLLLEEEEDEREHKAILEVGTSGIHIGSRMHECLVSILRIGICCSMPSPSDRMMMRDVVNQMHGIRGLFEFRPTVY